MSKTKTALITGITGQDGAYLAKFLLKKNYTVYGTFRRLSTPNFWRLLSLDIQNDVHMIYIIFQQEIYLERICYTFLNIVGLRMS